MRLGSGQYLREGALSARRVESRFAAILAPDEVTVLHDLIAVTARAKPAAPGSMIAW